MADGSYSGLTQYLVAPTRPPHLKALFARQADTGWYGGHNYRGGAHDLCRRRKWSFEQVLIQLEHWTAPPGVEAARARLREALDEIERWYWHLPLKSCPPLEGLADWYFDILDHPEDGPYWQPMNIVPHFGEIDVPIFHLGGWFDMFISGTLRMFQGVRRAGTVRSLSHGAAGGHRPLAARPSEHWPSSRRARWILGRRPRSIRTSIGCAGTTTGSRAWTRGSWTCRRCGCS